MKEQFDDKTIYCRMLGHPIPFRYCRSVNNALPCRKIRDCWYQRIDVDAYLAENFTAAEREQALAEAPEKITSLADLIRKARGE